MSDAIYKYGILSMETSSYLQIPTEINTYVDFQRLQTNILVQCSLFTGGNENINITNIKWGHSRFPFEKCTPLGKRFELYIIKVSIKIPLIWFRLQSEYCYLQFYFIIYTFDLHYEVSSFLNIVFYKDFYNFILSIILWIMLTFVRDFHGSLMVNTYICLLKLLIQPV